MGPAVGLRGAGGRGARRRDKQGDLEVHLSAIRLFPVAAILAALLACGGDAPTTPEALSDARRVDILVNGSGYTPDAVQGDPGEALVLVFDRPDAANCGGELVFPDSGRKVALPEGEKTEVPVTVPEGGALAFTCGMGMYQGRVVAR